MPESLHLPPLASAVITISGVVLAVVRLLTASRPFWDALPNWLQKAIPAAMVGLGVIPPAIENATSWVTVAEAVVIAIGAYYTASRGDKRPPVDKDGGPRLKRVNSDPKLTSAELEPVPPRNGPIGVVLLLAGLSLHQEACHSAPPCNEDKMRAIDAAYLSAMAKACLTYPSAAECPDYPALKAKHEHELEACPQ